MGSKNEPRATPSRRDRPGRWSLPDRIDWVSLHRGDDLFRRPVYDRRNDHDRRLAEVKPLDIAGRWFTMGLIFTGVGGVLWFRGGNRGRGRRSVALDFGQNRDGSTNQATQRSYYSLRLRALRASRGRRTGSTRAPFGNRSN